MAQPTLGIRIAASTAELKANMAEMRGQIEALGPSVQKMAATWSQHSSALITNAHAITAAVQQVGVGTLTAADAAKNLKVLDAALAQLKSTGQSIPPLMQDTADKLREVGGETSSWTSQLHSVSGLLGTLGIGLSVGAVVSFGQELLRTGDELVKVADRTGLTTIEVQKLQFIAGQSGNSIDDLTGAIGKLQQHLTSGDTNTVAAVEQLHLNLAQLKSATPYEQMEQIATAIAKVEDPAQRATLAMQLFGKSGTAILPTLVSQFSELGKQAPVMSDKTVRALDAAGDAIHLFTSQIKVWAAESYNFAGNLFDRLYAWAFNVSASIYTTIANLLDLAKHIPGASTAMNKLGIDTASLRQQADDWRVASKLQIEKLGEQEVAVRKTATAVVDFEPKVAKVKETTEKTTKALHDEAAALYAMNYQVVGVGAAEEGLALRLEVREKFQQLLNERTAQYYERLTALVPAQKDWWTQLQKSDEVLVPLSARLTTLGIATLPSVTSSLGASETAMEKFGSVAKASLGGLSDIFQRAFEGGGGVGGAIQSFATKATSGLLGMIPVAGKWLSEFAGPIVAGIKQLFGGPSKDELAARESFAKFQSQFGTLQQTLEAVDAAYIKMGKAGGSAAHDVQIALDATHHSAAEVEAALKGINDVLNEQAQDAADLDAAIKKYGFSIAELGPVMQKQQLDEQAKTLLNDWRLLVGSGIDVTTVNLKMATSVQEYLDLARTTGQEVPIEMQKILQPMIDQGTLLDENGEKITSLKGLGVTFSETMTQGFQKIVDRLDILLTKIGIDLPSVLNKIPHPDAPWSDWPIPPGVPDYMLPSGGAEWGGAQAAGGDYMVTRPTLFLAGDAGPERATFSGAGGRMSGGGGGSTSVNVNINAQGAYFDTPASRRRLANQVGAAVREQYDRQRRAS